MKNCESFVSSLLLAIDSTPALVWRNQGLNSSSKSTPEPPVPVPFGSPPWMTKGVPSDVLGDAVEDQIVVEAGLGQFDDPRGRFGARSSNNSKTMSP